MKTKYYLVACKVWNQKCSTTAQNTIKTNKSIDYVNLFGNIRTQFKEIKDSSVVLINQQEINKKQWEELNEYFKLL